MKPSHAFDHTTENNRCLVGRLLNKCATSFFRLGGLGNLGLMIFVFSLTGLLTPQKSYAIEEFTLEIRNHLFYPETLRVPAGVRFRLVIINEDETAEEFECQNLNREKIIPGHSKGVLFLGPLKKGTYPFFGEFNPNTAIGEILAE